MCIEDTDENTRNAYLTPDPSSQLGFSSPPQSRRPLSAIQILRPKISGEPITIGRSSVQCTYPIPQQFLNLYISRVHVVIAYLPNTQEISVQCQGMNPIYVNTCFETHKIEKGMKRVFGDGEDIKINVAGYVVIVEFPDASYDDSTRISLPTLTPPHTRTEYTDPEKKRIGERESALRLTSPPVPKLSKENPHQNHEIQIYHDTPRSPPLLVLSPPPDEISSPMLLSFVTQTKQMQSSPPTDVALLDAILTTLIFAEVKPTPLPRVIADLLHRMPNAPQDQIKLVLTCTPCIGIVHRSGKDAAGKELNDEYYYKPERKSG